MQPRNDSMVCHVSLIYNIHLLLNFQHSVSQELEIPIRTAIKPPYNDR